MQFCAELGSREMMSSSGVIIFLSEVSQLPVRTISPLDEIKLFVLFHAFYFAVTLICEPDCATCEPFSSRNLRASHACRLASKPTQVLISEILVDMQSSSSFLPVPPASTSSPPYSSYSGTTSPQTPGHSSSDSEQLRSPDEPEKKHRKRYKTAEEREQER